MSRRLLPLAAALTALALAGCGKGDDQFRAEYRTRSIADCVTGARSAPTAGNVTAMGVDFQKMCQCAVDRHLAVTPVDQLRNEGRSSAEPPDVRQAITQCISEELRAAPGANAAVPAALAPPPPPEPPKPGG